MKNLAYKIIFITNENNELYNIAHSFPVGLNKVVVIKPSNNLIDLVVDNQPDIVFLDVVNGEFDGIDFCILMRQNSLLKHIRIVFLTYRDESFTKIACLEAGADDVINLPIKNLVLLKKIQSLMRLYAIKNEIVDTNLIYIDRQNYVVVKNQTKINIPKKEFEILLLLSSAPERVFTMDEILSKIWGNDNLINNKSIPVYIKKLRNKIGDNHIITIKGIGYKFSYD